MPCTGSGEVHGTLCISTHQHYSGPLDEIAIYEHYNPASNASGTSMGHASRLAAIPSPTTHPSGPGPPRRGGALGTPAPGCVAQVGVTTQRQGVEGQQVRLGLQQQPGDHGHPALQVGNGPGQQPPGLLQVGGPEDRPDRRPDQLLEVLGAMPQRIAQEMDGATLPWSAQHPGRSRP